ncbi:MAG: c-type cytochrome [Xanthomonadaceae bacterium]|nr:c-type cytochrome [Xanthomonadaceae bacterium]MDE3072236.1 c-type cytochrome [Pseudomonadota bacterium]
MSSSKTVYAISLAAVLTTTACSQREVSYRRDINPIFQANCAICHTPGGVGYARSGFGVGTYQDVMKGTKYGPVVSPGNSVGSTLVRLVKHQADATINMPKNYTIDLTRHDNIVMPGVNARRLPERDIALIAKWVDQGARDN